VVAGKALFLEVAFGESSIKLLIDIGHPAHVHFYKHFINLMNARGHEVLVTARKKDNATKLLEAYSIDHIVVGKASESKLGLIKEWIRRDIDIYSIAKNFKPDIFTGINNPCMAHIAKITGSKSIIFNDTEHTGLTGWITGCFADLVCTPSSFLKDLGEKQQKYNGYHELAYLHEEFFKPKPCVIEEEGLKVGDIFFIVRFVSWEAGHDYGQRGFDPAGKLELIRQLKSYGEVVISSEGPLPEEFKKQCITVPVENIHSFLYYASLYVGEGATMASECCALGTPAIYVNTLTAGVLQEQEHRYGLVFSYADPENAMTGALKKVTELMQCNKLKDEWRQKAKLMLEEKINVTRFMVKLVEDYYADLANN